MIFPIFSLDKYGIGYASYKKLKKISREICCLFLDLLYVGLLSVFF